MLPTELPVTGPILFVSPMSGRLTARVPARLLLGTGLPFVTVGLLLMGNLSDSSAARRRRLLKKSWGHRFHGGPNPVTSVELVEALPA